MASSRAFFFHKKTLFFSCNQPRISVYFILSVFFIFHFHFFPKRFEWSQLDDVIVRKYNPLKEYGGWGLRGFGKKKAMTVAGNWLVEIVFVNGQSLLIGTCKPEELKAALALTKFKKIN